MIRKMILSAGWLIATGILPFGTHTARAASPEIYFGGSFRAQDLQDFNHPDKLYSLSFSALGRLPDDSLGQGWSGWIRGDMGGGVNGGTALMFAETLAAVEYRHGPLSLSFAAGPGYHHWNTEVGCNGCGKHEDSSFAGIWEVGTSIHGDSGGIFGVAIRGIPRERIEVRGSDGRIGTKDLKSLGVTLSWLSRF